MKTTTPNGNSPSAGKPSIDDMAKAATPKEIRKWIETLEAVYSDKKRTARNGLKDKVKSLLDTNGYTVEELFGARSLPSTDDLADQWDDRARAARDKKNRMIDSTLG